MYIFRLDYGHKCCEFREILRKHYDLVEKSFDAAMSVVNFNGLTRSVIIQMHKDKADVIYDTNANVHYLFFHGTYSEYYDDDDAPSPQFSMKDILDFAKGLTLGRAQPKQPQQEDKEEDKDDGSSSFQSECGSEYYNYNWEDYM